MAATLDRIKTVFATAFEVDEQEVDSLSYQSIEAWDSIGHMMMISGLEEEFDISIDMDDVVIISNLQECVEVVEKYL